MPKKIAFFDKICQNLLSFLLPYFGRAGAFFAARNGHGGACGLLLCVAAAAFVRFRPRLAVTDGRCRAAGPKPLRTAVFRRIRESPQPVAVSTARCRFRSPLPGPRPAADPSLLQRIRADCQVRRACSLFRTGKCPPFLPRILSDFPEKFCPPTSLNSTAFARWNYYNVIQNVSQGGGAGVA